jgi:uncharacterized phiE125 gp8 family phage protein
MQACYPITRPIRSAQPTFQQEPIDLGEAKRQCGVAEDVSHFDQDFVRWIVSARRQVEHDAQMVFYTGTFVWKISQFPYGDYITIPNIRPVTSITSIAYVDSAGATQTWSASEYALDSESAWPIIRLAYGESWPSVRGGINDITITLVAGYATVFAMPDEFKSALILKVRSFYKTAMGEDSRRDEEAYDRQINLIGREVCG